jgi:hypothetical protein
MNRRMGVVNGNRIPERLIFQQYMHQTFCVFPLIVCPKHGYITPFKILPKPFFHEEIIQYKAAEKELDGHRIMLAGSTFWAG